MTVKEVVCKEVSAALEREPKIDLQHFPILVVFGVDKVINNLQLMH